ncbi:MAG: glucan biosynthesis protein [Verrucomicrobiota bacterium]
MQPKRYAYTLYWTSEDDMKLSQNRVVSTRIGAHPRNGGWRQIVIDFDGPRLAAIPEGAPPAAIAHCSDNAAITENQVFYNPIKKNWRVILAMQPRAENKNPVDLRCTLQVGEEVVSETWTYRLESALICRSSTPIRRASWPVGPWRNGTPPTPRWKVILMRCASAIACCSANSSNRC